MSKVTVIMGKTLSGKTYLSNRLYQQGITRIITCTTRPMRKHEQNNIDYHFLNKEQLKDAKEKHNTLAIRAYHVANGQTWYYFLHKDDLHKLIQEHKDGIFILDLKGYLDLQNEINKDNDLSSQIHLQGLYLDIALKTRIMRHFNTTRDSDDDKEFVRRLADDELNAFIQLDDYDESKEAHDFAKTNSIKVIHNTNNFDDIINYVK